jgi:hypothetical protein
MHSDISDCGPHQFIILTVVTFKQKIPFITKQHLEISTCTLQAIADSPLALSITVKAITFTAFQVIYTND